MLYVDFCDFDLVFFLYYFFEYGFKIEFNKDYFIINSYIGDYKEILFIFDFISEIYDIYFYKYKGGFFYKDINKWIVKWMIRNNFLVDLLKINKYKDYEEINLYKICWE